VRGNFSEINIIHFILFPLTTSYYGEETARSLKQFNIGLPTDKKILN
jgi:hypothetical protein